MGRTRDVPRAWRRSPGGPNGRGGSRAPRLPECGASGSHWRSRAAPRPRHAHVRPPRGAGRCAALQWSRGAVKIVVFGLTISSTWGNGHATLWRGLCRALRQRGNEIVFFERDVAYYASHRDWTAEPGCDLVLYDDWADVVSRSRRELGGADVGMVTSYCPDGPRACELVLDSP